MTEECGGGIRLGTTKRGVRSSWRDDHFEVLGTDANRVRCRLCYNTYLAEEARRMQLAGTLLTWPTLPAPSKVVLSDLKPTLLHVLFVLPPSTKLALHHSGFLHSPASSPTLLAFSDFTSSRSTVQRMNRRRRLHVAKLSKELSRGTVTI